MKLQVGNYERASKADRFDVVSVDPIRESNPSLADFGRVNPSMVGKEDEAT
jgi:hypothetical protein